MGKITLSLHKVFYVFLLLCWINPGKTEAQVQTLKLTDFAVWGGSASSTTYNSTQGVFIGNTVAIQGNIGSNHRVDVKNIFNLTGNIYSGNAVSLGNIGKVTGNIFAAKNATNYSGNVISGDFQIKFIGNLTAKGKIFLKALSGPNATSVTGQVAVPAPTSINYSGPVPTGGISIVNTATLPVLPPMPNNTAFDSQVAPSNSNTNITNTKTISPGVYRKIALPGNKILTFNGPGNYIFYEVDNGVTSNKLVFNFNNTSAGTINIYIIKDAKWGRLSVSTVNGNFPSRIYTEIHGTGSANGGNTFDIIGPVAIPTGSHVWLGNVWAPNGGISVKSLNPYNAPHIIGALWSSKKVELDQNLKLVYQAPAAGPNFNYIAPYYPPPVDGKVTTANNTIGAELFSLSQNPTPIDSISDNNIFLLDDNNNVMIEVVTTTANDGIVKTRLINAGMTDIVDNGPNSYVITGNFPIIKLPLLNQGSSLNTDGRIKEAYPFYPPISNAGLVTTQGDITMRSNVVRSRFGLDGSGVKIGVISDSYDLKHGAQTDVDEGDLPGIKSTGQPNDNPDPVQVVEDLLGQRGSDEGRAMLQIVHDIAPKAKLAFCTGFLSERNFARTIGRLASDTLPGGRCDVIIDDITYITAPFLGDGEAAKAVNDAVARGVTYFSSAGNFGSQSYEAVFNGVTNTSVIPTPGQIHNFASTGTDLYQSINLKPGSYTIVLQWSDKFFSSGHPVTQTDLDLYVLGSNGFRLFGFNRNNLLSGDPFEVCPFTVKDTTNAKIMVVSASGATNVRFKYIIFRGDATILNYQTGTSTIVGHPNADGAIAVGAMLYDSIPPFTSVWPGVASFSSRGGTLAQPSYGNNFTLRNKPEIIGPNGVNTTVNLGGPQFNDGDTYPNFFGTSAAAPHAAAVGALLIQARKKYNLQTTVSPSEIRQQLQSSAGKFSNLPGNFSFEGGYGYVRADSAVQQIANARPIISTLVAVNPGGQNGTQPFMVKITGKYLTSTTQIHVSNSPYPTTVSIDPLTGVGTAKATVPAIPAGQDPPFQLYNPPKSPSNLDGGLSEALHFFSSAIRIIVKPEKLGHLNFSRRYGQENPVFTATITRIIGLDTVDISQTGLTPADLKLDDLTFATNAEPFSSPRSYGISVARTMPLAPGDPLLSQYTFEFEPGILTVEKMPLKITPNFKTIKYGDDLSGITYSYLFDTSGVVSPHLLEEVNTLHKKYVADNGLILINGFNSQNITGADLDSMGTMASFQAVLNARKFIVENGQLKPLINNLSVSQLGLQRFIVDVSAQSLQNYKLNHSQSTMVEPLPNVNSRAFLNIKALTNGSAKAAVSGGELQPMVNGQLLAMVNGQLQALVNGQLQAIVNSTTVGAQDLAFQNGQLLALVNGVWTAASSGQISATVNGQQVTVDLSVSNGQLQAIVNGQLMALVNGQLQAIVNGVGLLAIANGQLQALVNGQLIPMVNGQLTAIVNGQLQAMVNGQLMAIVNGQLMALVNGQLEIVQDLILSNGQLQAIVNGQLQALVNGQLQAMVNGVVTNIPTTDLSLVNGQLQAIVNGQLQALVNGQLLALVNGQLQPLVNGAALPAESVRQLANGRLQALVNGTYIPIANGQLQALVNGQLLAMVNGQLMAIVNGKVTFVVFQNGQLQALVNGQLQALVNGQLQAMVNGQLQALVNSQNPINNSYRIVNGQLQAIVNGQTWAYANGQLLALVNGQLQPLVNNFDVSGSNNNAKTLVLVDEDDINLQSGDVGGMFSMNMITGLEAGYQTLIPGAFIDENFEVTYGLGNVLIDKKPLTVSADNKTKNEGDPNPPLTVSYNGFAFGETKDLLCLPVVLIDQLERRTTYTNVQINGASNVYVASPGEVLTLTGNWNWNHFQNISPGYITYCPGCVTQLRIGMSNGLGGNAFATCHDVSGLGGYSGIMNSTFNAPSAPGIYYITQISTWWYTCPAPNFGDPPQIPIHTSGPNDAIAVVVVSPYSVPTYTTATVSSPQGDYPIIVGGCHFNPNYRIVFKDGTLTVGEIPSRIMNNTITSQTQPAQNAAISKISADNLYPNPASSILRLQLKDDVQSIKDIRVYDGVGKLNVASSSRISDGVYEINVSGLSRGMYIIEARTAEGIKTFKFIKM